MPEHRLYANDLAGGGILDVGGYPVSMARLIAGAAVGEPFAEPEQVAGTAHLGQSGVDEWASAVLRFPSGIVAEVSCSISLNQDNVLRILGTKGRIEVKDFWFAGGKEGGTGEIHIIRPDGSEIVAVKEDGWLYSFEADAAGEAILAGKQELAWPGMGWADSLGNLAVLDKWRAASGLEYGIEKPAGRPNTISGRKLKSGGTAIPRRAIPGLTPPASVVALGFEDFRSFSSGAILLDAFFEAGGNLFDTGFVYGGGRTEALLGEWMGNRGVREQSVVIGKGAHSPLCYPDMIGKQLTQSLDRMKTGHVDIYFMHRDNPDVPVGEFVDAMDAEVKAGRIRGPFGGSNWTMRAHGRGDRLCRKERQAEARRALQQFLAGRDARPDLAGLHHLLQRRMEGTGWRRGRCRISPGRARAAASSPTAPAATRPTMRSWCGSGTPKRISAAATAPSSSPKSSARARSTWRWPMCWRSPSPRCR